MQKAKRTRMCRVGHDWIWATLPVHSTHLPRPLKSSNQSRPSPPKWAWIYAIFITKKWKILWQHFTFITRYMGVMVWRVAGECEGPGTLSLPSKRPPQLPPLIPMHPPRDSTPNLQTPQLPPPQSPRVPHAWPGEIGSVWERMCARWSCSPNTFQVLGSRAEASINCWVRPQPPCIPVFWKKHKVVVSKYISLTTTCLFNAHGAHDAVKAYYFISSQLRR